MEVIFQILEEAVYRLSSALASIQSPIYPAARSLLRAERQIGGVKEDQVESCPDSPEEICSDQSDLACSGAGGPQGMGVDIGGNQALHPRRQLQCQGSAAASYLQCPIPGAGLGQGGS